MISSWPIQCVAAAALPRGKDESGAAEWLQPRHREVVSDVESERQPFVLAIFTEHADALLPAPARARGSPGDADANASRADRLHPEYRAQQPRPPRSISPAIPRISPRCSVKVADPGSRASTSSRGVPFEPRRRAERDRRPAADHHLDDLLLGRVRRGASSSVPSVAQDHEAIGDLFTSSMKCEM